MSWLARLANRKVRLSDFADDSKSWARCAVGEAGDVVKFTRKDEPKDHRLHDLGVKFHHAIQRNDRETALALYLAIQRRVLRLAGLRK